VDSSLRQQGIINFDLAVFKRTIFGPDGRMGLELGWVLQFVSRLRLIYRTAYS
jgi:hypothetical protein